MAKFNPRLSDTNLRVKSYLEQKQERLRILKKRKFSLYNAETYPILFFTKKHVTSINQILLYQHACDIKITIIIQPSGSLFSEMWK